VKHFEQGHHFVLIYHQIKQALLISNIMDCLWNSQMTDVDQPTKAFSQTPKTERFWNSVVPEKVSFSVLKYLCLLAGAAQTWRYV
jgi:hypothetical protein